jgi:hypothetical protein
LCCNGKNAPEEKEMINRLRDGVEEEEKEEMIDRKKREEKKRNIRG